MVLIALKRVKCGSKPAFSYRQTIASGFALLYCMPGLVFRLSPEYHHIRSSPVSTLEEGPPGFDTRDAVVKPNHESVVKLA